MIHTGYHKYGWDEPEADEEEQRRDIEDLQKKSGNWCKGKTELKWIGVHVVRKPSNDTNTRERGRGSKTCI